jgi:uncharacterized protein
MVSMDIETIQYGEMNLKVPIAVIGFPSVGLTSSIMANMYVRSLDMVPLVGLASAYMPPYCIVTEKNVLPPLRFFGYKNKRKNGHDVILCMTEYAPKPEDCYFIANKVIQILRSKGVRTIVCMEGTPKYDGSKVLTVAAGPNAEKLIKKSGLPVMTEGIIRGFVGVLMYEAPSKGMDIITIMVPATSGVPDPGSSTAFIEPVAKLIPGFKTKPNELLKEAEIIQQQMEMATKNMGETSQYIG